MTPGIEQGTMKEASRPDSARLALESGKAVLMLVRTPMEIGRYAVYTRDVFSA